MLACVFIKVKREFRMSSFFWQTILFAVSICFWLSRASAQGVASEISHISLLMPFGSFQKVNATPGCFYWDSSNPDAIEVSLDENAACRKWPGSSRAVTLLSTKKVTTALMCKIRATPVSSSDDCDELSLDVYVSSIARLEILTTARRIGVDESEIVEVQAFDEQGNVFSTLESVEFYWSISPQVSGPLKIAQVKEDDLKPHYGNVDGLTSSGPSIKVTGIKSGSSELSVRLADRNDKQIEASVLINVVETLKLCPSAVYSPILLMSGSVLQFYSYIDRTSISIANNCLSEGGDAIAMERHRKDIEDGKYIWRINEDPNESVASIESATGLFTAKAIGTVTVSFEETSFPINGVNAAVKIVQPEIVSLMMTGSENVKANFRSKSGGCPWVSIGKFPHYRFLPSLSMMKSEAESEWIMVLGRTYHILATPFSETRTVALSNPGRYALLVTPPMSFTFLDEGKLEFETHELHGNVVTAKPKEAGITFVEVEMFVREQRILTSLKKKILIAEKLSPSLETIRLPFKHHWRMSFLGGSGDYSFSSVDCERESVGLDKYGLVTTLERNARCSISCADSKDSTNFAEANVVISEPSALSVKDKLNQYYMPVDGFQIIEVVARDADGELYTNCSDLTAHLKFRQDKDLVHLETVTASSSPGVCFALKVTGLHAGIVQLDISHPKHRKVREQVNFIIYSPLLVLEPIALEPLSKLPMAVVSLSSTSIIIIEGGVPKSDVFFIDPLGGKDSRAVTPVAQVSAVILKNRGVIAAGTRRSFEIQCLEAGEYMLSIESGDSLENLLLFCSCPIRGEIVLPQEDLHLDSEGSIITAAPGKLNLRTDYYDLEHRKFSDISALDIEWGINVDENIARIEYNKIRATFWATQFSPSQQEVEVFSKTFCEREITVSRKISLISIPVLKPAVHPSILANSNAFARFQIESGSGNFNVYSDNENVLIERSDRTLIVRTRNGVVGKVRIFCRDLALNEDKPAFATVEVSEISQLTLHAEMNRAAVGDVIPLSIQILDQFGNRFSRSVYKLLTYGIQMNKENILGDLDDSKIGYDDCLEPVQSVDDEISCFGTWRLKAKALTADTVQVSASVKFDDSLLLYSKIPVIIDIFEPLRVIPENVLLLPGGRFNIRKLGGPGVEEGTNCHFESVDTEVVQVLEQETGKIEGGKIGTSQVLCICIDDYGSIVAQAVTNVRVKTLSEIRLVGDMNIVKGGKTKFTVVGPEGETPMMFSSPSQPFLWSVSDNSVVDIEEDEKRKHTIWVYAKDVGETQINLQLKLSHSGFYSAPLHATATINVVPKLELLSPSVVNIPCNSEVKIETNLDHSSRIRYSVFAPEEAKSLEALSQKTHCSCNDEAKNAAFSGSGLSFTSDGVVSSDNEERSYIVLVTFYDGDGSDTCCGTNQQHISVHVHVRKVVSLGIEIDAPAFGVGQHVKARIALIDCMGYEFSKLHRGPKVELFDNVQGIVRFHQEVEPYTYSFVGVEPGFVTIQATLSGFANNFTISEKVVIDFIDLTVTKSPVKLIPLNITHEKRKPSERKLTSGNDLEEYGIVIVVALFIFLFMWMLCGTFSNHNRRSDTSRYTPYPYSGSSLYRRQY